MLYARNDERRVAAMERNYGAPHPEIGDTRADRIRALPCLGRRRLGHRCQGPVQAAHVEPRRMGGKGGDRHRLAPLCSVAHREAGELPSLWYRADAERYATTQRGRWEAAHAMAPEGLLAEADRLAAELTAEGYP